MKIIVKKSTIYIQHSCITLISYFGNFTQFLLILNINLEYTNIENYILKCNLPKSTHGDSVSG